MTATTLQVLRTVMLIASLALGSTTTFATDYYFTPPAYRHSGNQVRGADSPEQACNALAALWGWAAPYSHALEPAWPGAWKCQRYLNGVVEPGYYAYVEGQCQRSPSPPVTGGDWNYPQYNMWAGPDCWCTNSQVFDRSTEWCTGSPTCLHYPENKHTECGATVDALYQVTKSSTDPTRIFHDTQTCIARKSCDLRCKMENCDWLRSVVPSFVGPYLAKAGSWPTAEAECAARGAGWFADRWCANLMAINHIYQDLLPAVTSYGCGSAVDWQQVFSVIRSCTQSSVGEGVVGGLASGAVLIYRESVRAMCTADRVAAGVDPEINEDLRGRTCTP